MCVLSSTSITRIKMDKSKFIYCIIAFLFVSFHVFAQDSSRVVQPIQPGAKTSPVVDFWVFGSACHTEAGHSYFDFKDMYETYTNVGLRTEIYIYPKLRKFQQNGKLNKEDSPTKKLFAIRPSLAIGYKYDRIAYQDDRMSHSGFYGHWLTFDANLKIVSVCAGVSVDVLMKQRLDLNDQFNYVGLNTPCINPVVSRWYIGVLGAIPFAELELRFGWCFSPIIDPDKYAYYNLSHFRSYGYYTEIRMAFRLFSTGKRI